MANLSSATSFDEDLRDLHIVYDVLVPLYLSQFNC